MEAIVSKTLSFCIESNTPDGCTVNGIQLISLSVFRNLSPNGKGALRTAVDLLKGSNWERIDFRFQKPFESLVAGGGRNPIPLQRFHVRIREPIAELLCSIAKSTETA